MGLYRSNGNRTWVLTNPDKNTMLEITDQIYLLIPDRHTPKVYNSNIAPRKKKNSLRIF